MKKRIKSVIMTTVSAGAGGIGNYPASSMYRGENALVEALADFYELEDITALAGGLASLLVRCKAVELENEKMWKEWEEKEYGHRGT